MNYRFLRDEAARFRTMAEESDRETTRQRLLAMAADYEARSKLAELSSVAENAVEPALAKPEDDVAVPAEDSPEKPGKLRLSGRTSRGLKEPVPVEHRTAARRSKDPYP